MFEEYASVVATTDLSDNITVGCHGAVLICYEGGTHYEVEFDEHCNHLGLITVAESEIDALAYHDMNR